jgi:uncharacterized lipoprotein YmbA
MKTFLLISFLLLQSCANTPPTHFYSLEPIAAISDTLQSSAKKPLVGIAQISLPSVIERKQIVTRDATGQLIINEQHQWAALLKQNITEVLATNLAVRQPNYWFKAAPWSLLGMVDYRLVIDVTRLDIVLGKSISFSVDWTILNEKHHTILQHNSLDFNQPLADENYSTAILGLNTLLVLLSEKLAAAQF